MPPPPKPPRKLPPLETAEPEKRPAFFAPDVEETLGSRQRVGTWLNATTHAVHLEGEGDARRLVTRGGTDAAEHVRRSNGTVFYEAHGGARRTGEGGQLERRLEFATAPEGESRYLGEKDASTVLANSFSDARTVTILACNYGRGKGRALRAVADKITEAGAEAVSVRAPTVNFARQTLPGPGVAPTTKQRKLLPPIERRRETMTRPDNTQLGEMLGTGFWQTAEGGAHPEPAMPQIPEPAPKPGAQRAKSMPPVPSKPRWR